MCLVTRGFTPWPNGLHAECVPARWDGHGTLVVMHDPLPSGIPWELFRGVNPLSYTGYRKKAAQLGGCYAAWLDRMDAFKAACGQRLVYLSLDVTQDRNPYPRVSCDKNWDWPVDWTKGGLPSFERETVRNAAKRCVRWLCQHFSPIALCPQAEIDTVWVRAAQWPIDFDTGLRRYVEDTYRFVRADFPYLPIFPGWQRELLLSRGQLGLALLDSFVAAGVADVIGMSIYPADPTLTWSQPVTRAADLPSDWLDLFARYQKPCAVLETYWQTDGVPGSASEHEQAAYVRRLFADLRRFSPMFVGWFFWADWVVPASPFPIPFTPGLVDWTGRAKPALAVWDAA